MKPRNARFWVWFNDSWVKLTLRKDEEISDYGFRYTDEGWESWSVSWSFDGLEVTRVRESSGSDCDGRLDRSSVQVCHVDDLKGYETPDGTLVPDWKEAESWQRDYAAEAAGY